MCKTDVDFSEDEVHRGFWNSTQSSAIFLYTSFASELAASILNNVLLISLNDQIVVLGVTI